MEAEDALLSAHEESSDDARASVDIHDPEASLPVSSIPAETPSAVEETSQGTAPESTNDEPQSPEHSLLVDANSSEAVLSAQSEQSMQADASEILVPSPSMALLHSQRPEPDTDRPQADMQLEQPVSPMQESVAAESEVADAAVVSPTEAQANTSDDNIAAEQLSPAQDAPVASGEQEAGSPPVVHATFVVPTENWKHLQIVPLATTAAEIKHSLCSNWNIAESALSVKYNKQELQDAQTLASCGIQVSLLSSPSCPRFSSDLTLYWCMHLCAPATGWDQTQHVKLSCFSTGRRAC